MMKLSSWSTIFLLVVFCAATAIASPAQAFTSARTFTVLHSFDSTDGASPYAALVQATDGNLYGTTVGGGANNVGTVFKITTNGTLTTLHSFDGPDGANSVAGLVQGTNGNFYGTTPNGGANGGGTVFEITPGGKVTTGSVGGHPYGGLVLATDGNIYGTTSSGGGQRRWHGLQNHPKRQAHDAAQFRRD
jgi:uncharacterized repeat protein (TIGR03803 family)